MAYQLDPTKPLDGEIARVAREVLGAGAGGAPAGGSLAGRVHRGRTTCKKVRALLRLLRAGQRGFFRRENRRLREAARGLAVFRDAEALLAAARFLKPAGRTARATLPAFRRRLDAHRRSVQADPKAVAKQLAAFSRELNASLAAVKRWKPKVRGFAGIALEIEETYRRARRLGKGIDRDARGTEYHGWRKAVKAFGYHCRLLRGAWPEVTKPFSREVDRLGELLGMEHDLAGLDEFIAQAGSGTGLGIPARSARRIRQLIRRQRFALRRQADAAGKRLFAEKPRPYVTRLQHWWKYAQS